MQIYDQKIKYLLSEAEFLMLKEIDLAFLSSCEHACELATSLIEEWLSTYLLKENKTAAKEATTKLGSMSDWHSHGRYISIEKLVSYVGIPIQDYTHDMDKKNLIRDYNDLLTQFVERNRTTPIFLHSRTYF